MNDIKPLIERKLQHNNFVTYFINNTIPTLTSAQLKYTIYYAGL